jgi:hypothetical protein
MEPISSAPQYNVERRALSLQLLVAALWLISLYIWILPLLWPRGEYLWGHYRLRDIYLGIPIAVATFCLTALMVAPARHRRALAMRLISLSASSLIILFAADAAYALVYLGAWKPNLYLDVGDVPRLFNVRDAELGFRTLPNLRWHGKKNKDAYEVDFRTDKNGFRNPPGVTKADIVFIGDSYTEGAEVPEEQTFVRRVSDATGLTAVNLGAGAYGPQQELIVLRKYGLAYKPRFVVWQIFGGNDLADAQSFVVWRQNQNKAYLSLPARYAKNSLLNSLLTVTQPERPEFGTVPADLHLTDGTIQPLHILYPYQPDQPQRRSVGLAETFKAIEEGQQLCESQGIQLVVVYVPIMARVMAPYLSFDKEDDLQRVFPGNVAESPSDFESELVKYCRSIECPLIDLYPEFKQAAARDNRKIYLPNDEHFDIRGHEITAQVVSAWVDSNRKE